MAETRLAETEPARSLYDSDFNRWSESMSAHLRERRAAGLDWDNLAEEIEALGANNRRELKSRLRVLIAHLLKWQYQPELREGSTWKATIRGQRDHIEDLLEDSPSLAGHIARGWAQVYGRAAALARDEMETAQVQLPASCPYAQDEVLDPNFYPG